MTRICGVLLAVWSSSVFAVVNVKHVMVDSQFMRFPKIALDGINYKALDFEYAVKGSVKVSTINESSELAKCGLSHYLSVEYQGPEIVFRIQDSGRKKTLLRKKMDTDGTSEYGRGECRSIKDVKAEFDEQMLSWSKTLEKQIVADALKEMTIFMEESTALKYEDIRFPLFFVSADGTKYDDLNEAFDRARKAFDLYMQFGVTIDAHATLVEVAQEWEGLLKNLVNSKNPSPDHELLELVLHRNLCITYFFIGNFDQARRHDALAESKGMPKKDTLQPLILKHERLLILSPAVVKDLVLMANLYRFGTNVMREAVLKEVSLEKLTLDK